MTTQRLYGESIDDYLIRLYSNKDELQLSSNQISELLNAESEEKFSESKWRKDYAQYLRWSDYTVKKNLDEDKLNKYEEVRIESEKEKIRKRDWNREYNKKIANSARFEALHEDVINAVHNLNRVKPFLQSDIDCLSESNKQGVLLLSDWHVGSEIDNRVNKYNREVFIDRVERLINNTIEYGRTHSISTIHVANLGDIISGLIHVSTRVQSNQNLIEQIMFAAETLAECLVKLSENFKTVKFYNICGNHSRIMPSKNDVGIKENFENLVPWFLEARLKDVNNVEIVNEQDGICETKIFNENIIFVHGDYDSPQSSYAKLPQLLGYVPQLIFSGHIHHHFEKEFGETTAIVNGCLSGVDDYAMKGRFSSKPSQKFCVIDENNGLECVYQIKLG